MKKEMRFLFKTLVILKSPIRLKCDGNNMVMNVVLSVENEMKKRICQYSLWV